MDATNVTQLENDSAQEDIDSQYPRIDTIIQGLTADIKEEYNINISKQLQEVLQALFAGITPGGKRMKALEIAAFGYTEDKIPEITLHVLMDHDLPNTPLDSIHELQSRFASADPSKYILNLDITAPNRHYIKEDLEHDLFYGHHDRGLPALYRSAENVVRFGNSDQIIERQRAREKTAALKPKIIQLPQALEDLKKAAA